MSDALAIAIITGFFTGIPAFIAAMASYRKATETKAQLTPSNGHKVAELVEELHSRQKYDHDHIEMMHSDMRSLREDFKDHLEDAVLHYREQHEHYRQQGTHICATCLGLQGGSS